MKDQVIKIESFVDDKGVIKLPHELFKRAAAFAGKEVFITVEEKLPFRTLDQNAYYRVAIVRPICDRFNDLGERFTEDIVHEILKYKFLAVYRYDEKTDRYEVLYVRSTTSLKVHEFSFFIEDCIRYAAEDLELTIEPPKERRADFVFSQYPKEGEVYKTYVKRIERYLEDITRPEDLLRYFGQNEDWASDEKIKSIFRKRYQEITEKRA